MDHAAAELTFHVLFLNLVFSILAQKIVGALTKTREFKEKKEKNITTY